MVYECILGNEIIINAKINRAVYYYVVGVSLRMFVKFYEKSLAGGKI